MTRQVPIEFVGQPAGKQLASEMTVIAAAARTTQCILVSEKHMVLVGQMELLSRIALKAVELGGAVSGEHGIGFLKIDILAQSKRGELRAMKAIKDALDPNGILNPGKLFPSESTQA